MSAVKLTLLAASPSLRHPAFALQEFVVLLEGIAPPTNPFDPQQLAIDGILTGPRGQRLRLPAYWGGTNFRLCLTLPTPGKWTLVATAQGVRSNSLTLEATPSRDPGFIERPQPGQRYFALSNGQPYFLVGENVCWAGSGGLKDYVAWFGALSKAGGNFARLWMAWQPLENKMAGPGRYDLANARYFAQVLDLAQQTRIRCMLCFMTYGELATGGYFNEGRWPESPYNAKNGGPVPADKPEQFFTLPAARQLYKNRLRYMVARYSAFTSLGFWELWNEKDAPREWLAEMSSYLRALDPYRHPITHSYSTTGPDDVWQLPTLDLTQTHRYGDEGSVPDIAPLILSDTHAHERFRKPHLMGEFGISWRGPDTQFDPNTTATNLHNGLWASALSGAAGGAAIWWWDNYVHPKNLYHHFTGLARFAARIPWTQRQFAPLTLPAAQLPATGTETFRDLALTPTGGWGDKAGGITTIAADGTVTGPLPGFLYGPGKPELKSTLTFQVTLRQPATLRLRILTVSDRATLTVTVDGKPAATFPFFAAPGKGQDFESTKHFPEYGGIYQALFNKDRSVTLPAGKHTVRIENTVGDWVSLGGYTFTGAWSSRFIRLRTPALQDAATGETLAWIQDPESNWKNDRDRRPLQHFTGVRLPLPLPRSGNYTVEWWDTYAGKITRTEQLMAVGKTLTLTVPPFTRDIALRVRPR